MELPSVTDGSDQRGGDQRTKSRDRHQTPGSLVRAGALGNPLVVPF